MSALCILVLACLWANSPPPGEAGSPVPSGKALVVCVVLGLTYVFSMVWIVFWDNAPLAGIARKCPPYAGSCRLLLCLAAILVLLVLMAVLLAPGGRLDGGEPYALLEGVSMWASQGIRLATLLLAGYFTIDVCHFPGQFTQWLDDFKNRAGRAEPRGHSTAKHHGQAGPQAANALSLSKYMLDYLYRRLKTQKPPDSAPPGKGHCLEAWFEWQHLARRLWVALVCAIAVHGFSAALLFDLGLPHDPYRGESMAWLNQLLLRGLLVPAFIFLLCLVVDAIRKAAILVENAVSDDPDYPVHWAEPIRQVYKDRFKIDIDELHEWAGMRFVNELTKRIYRIIGYPLVVVLLMVLSRSTYFDNWVTPPALNLIIGLSLATLLYWDYRLKQATDRARQNALKALRYRILSYSGPEAGGGSEEKRRQLGQMVELIEHSDAVVYKPFTQRPIFQNSILIVAALLADSVDYSVLASKLF